MHRSARLDAPDVEVTDFAGLEIGWDRRVLRPRPWTAEQGRWAADLLLDAPDGPILELCCGAGHIGLLAAHGSGRDLVQVDEDPTAAAYARRNAEAAHVRSDVRAGPLGGSLRPDERFPMVIADPPWLPMVGVSYPDEPVEPATGAIEGVDALHECVGVCLDHLSPEGHLVLQVGLSKQIERLAGWLAEYSAADLTMPERAVLDVRDRRPGGYLVHVGPVEEAG
jgi:release factor glutamine methyltransferase